MMVNIGIGLYKTQFTECVRGESGDRFKQYPKTAEGFLGIWS
jgi:hypothetical protein